MQNTETVLREDLKLSRIPADAVTDIGSLARGEGREVLERTLDYLGDYERMLARGDAGALALAERLAV